MADSDKQKIQELELKLKELSQSEERFRLMVTSVTDYAIFMLNPDGTIASWNEGARKFKGYEASEVIGQHFSKFYTEPDIARKHPEHELSLALQNGKYEEEGWRVRKDGTRFWANVVITRVNDLKGQLLGFTKVTRDLTERKNAEEDLRRSEERLRLMIAAVKDYAIFMLDPDGRIASWNEGAKRFKGYEEREVIGKHFSMFYMQSDIDRGHPAFELKRATEDGRYEEEGWRIRKDGTKFWANVVITRVNDSQGRLMGFVKVTRDLTEKKQAFEILEQKVQERTKDLEAALRTRDEFLSIASHELKTPLTSLKLQLQISNRRVSKEPEESHIKKDLSKSLDIGIRQVNSLNHLVDDLLDVSRIQTGVLTLNNTKFNVTELVEEILFRFQVQLNLAHCKISKNLDLSLEGNWDRNRIEQVLVNLVFNAIKYAPGTEVKVTTRKENDHAIIEVADHGPGIDQSHIDMIFERFTRVGSPQNVGGLGLGLFITKKIVELHQGSIKVDTAPGKGANFIVCLPL